MDPILFLPTSTATRGGPPGNPPAPTSFPYFDLRRLEELLRLTESGAASALGLLIHLASARSGRDSTRVALLAVELGHRTGLSESEIRDLEYSSLLHDIGFLFLPDGMLLKPGRLSTHERRQVRRHPEFARAILGRIPGFSGVSRIVGHHHERLDGQGYPDALPADGIPLGARVLGAVERFAAMLTERSYRASLPLGEAVRRLRRAAGSAYDPEIVRLIVDEAALYHRILSDPRVETVGRLRWGWTPADALVGPEN